MTEMTEKAAGLAARRRVAYVLYLACPPRGFYLLHPKENDPPPPYVLVVPIRMKSLPSVLTVRPRRVRQAATSVAAVSFEFAMTGAVIRGGFFWGVLL